MSALATPIDPLQWLPLARKVARRYHRHAGADPALDYEDMEQEAFLRLHLAARAYDGRTGFEVFAMVNVANQLVKLLDAQHRPLRVPHRVRALARGLRDGRVATGEVGEGWAARLAAARQVERARTVRMQRRARGLKVEGSYPDLGFIEDRHGREPDAAELAEALEALARLPWRLREVVRAHLGLYGGPPGTFDEIGRALGVTHARVGQLYEEALTLLKARLRADRDRSA